MMALDLTTETVRTDRLVLRPLRSSDVDVVHRRRAAAGCTQEGVARSCLGYRDGTPGDAVLFGRLR